jgi:tetratricopeptide (TPR) repeat protein
MKMRLSALVLLSLALAAADHAQAQTSRAEEPHGTAGYYFLLGRHLESQGKVDEAIAAHHKAIDMDPDSAELRAELAALYARQDRAVEAVDAAEAALKRDAGNKEANRILGTVLAAYADQKRPIRAGDDPSTYAARAIAALEKARSDRGSDIGLDLTLGRLYLQTRAYENATASLRRVVDERPDYPDAALLLANAQESAGQTGEAVQTLATAVKWNPRFVRGYLRLAELSEKEGQWQTAADAYARVQALNARGVDVTSRRAAALLNAGKAAEARELLRAPAAATNADLMVLYLFAVAQRQTQDISGAEETAHRLRARAPNDPRGSYVLAQILESKRDYVGAEKALRDILSRDPEDATALNHLGYMLAERGERLTEAIGLIERALKLEPDNPSFLDSLGWAYFQQGKIDLADRPITDAAAKLPNSSAVQEHLGDLRYRQQRFADAIAAWERALTGDGESLDRERIERKLREARERR